MPDFDATEMRAHLNDYLKEINDLMTVSGSVDQYADFWAALIKIDAVTRDFYTRRQDGSFPVLNENHKDMLQKQYREAIAHAGQLLSGEDQGDIASSMRTIARELMPLMLNDQTALEMVDVTKTPITLPELVGKAREQAVDLGEQESVIEHGFMSSRQHMYVESGRLDEEGHTVREEGYFTPTIRVQARSDFADLMDRMAAKYPQYGRLLEELRQAKFSNVMEAAWNKDFYRSASKLEEPSPDKLREHMKNEVNGEVFRGIVRLETVAAAEAKEDFFAFFDELRENINPVKKVYDQYVSDTRTVDVREGANIDKRNVAMYRMSCLLGKPNLVAEAKPMTVIQNGVSVTGTFMAAAHGLDINKVKPGDPEAAFTEKNLENPPVYDDIAAMQALDFICGNTDRHIGNMVLQFEAGKGRDAKITGLTLIDNDASFTNGQTLGGSNYIVPPEDMGVVGEDFYHAMKLMSKAEMTMMLADCELSRQEIDWAWERKEQLQAKIEADRAFYQDKEPGFLDKNHIRVVPKSDWKQYSMAKMAEMFPGNAFFRIGFEIPGTIRKRVAALEKSANKPQGEPKISGSKMARSAILDVPPEPEEKKETVVPTGRTVGSRLIPQVPNPGREDVVKLSVPPLSTVTSVGAQMSRRFTLSYQDGDQTKQVFFTQPSSLSNRVRMDKVIDDLKEKHPKYRDALDAIRTVYLTNEAADLTVPEGGKILSDNLGLPEARIQELEQDREFLSMAGSLARRLNSLGDTLMFYDMSGANMASGRIDTRNAAMSDVGDLLNAPNVLARSRVAQVECDGRIIEGVIMENAAGVTYEKTETGADDKSRIREEKITYDKMQTGGSCMSRIEEKRINEAYNTPEGLKSIADLQILDYVCLNLDRHLGNITYCFQKDDVTDQMRFTGVRGIDNDMSFGSHVPQMQEQYKCIGALNQMQVISAEMWEKINDPTTAEKLAEKLRRNGLSDQEIEGAQKRMEMIRTAVKDNTLRVVGKEEWAKGDFTFEKLTEKNSTLFCSVRQVAREAVKAREKWNSMSDKEKEDAEKQLAFTQCVKVDQFGKTLMENKELSELRDKTAEDFRSQLIENLHSAPEPEDTLSGRQLVQRLQQAGRDFHIALNRADPLFHGTSKEYKKLKSSCRELEKMAKKIGKSLTAENPSISGKEGELLYQKLTEISRYSTIYQLKKQREVESGRPLSTVGQARVNVASQLSAQLSDLTVTADRSIAKQGADRSPAGYLNRRMARSQRELSGLEGTALRRKVAEVLSFRSLADMDNKKELKKNGELVIKLATKPEQIRNMTDWMMKQPAFQKMVRDMPDNELRAMAAVRNGRRLYDKFLSSKTMDARNAQKQAERQKSLHRQQKPREMAK